MSNSKTIQVVLQQDVKNIGNAGEVQSVPNGYAKNFLLPKKLAVIATDASLQQARTVAAKQKQQQERQALQTQTLLQQVQKADVQLARKTNEKNTLYAALHEKDILAGLQQRGIQGLTEKEIHIKEPITAIGEYTAAITIGGSTVKVPVRVTSL